MSKKEREKKRSSALAEINKMNAQFFLVPVQGLEESKSENYTFSLAASETYFPE